MKSGRKEGCLGGSAAEGPTIRSTLPIYAVAAASGSSSMSSQSKLGESVSNPAPLPPAKTRCAESPALS